jgi:hypothetical protein
MQVYNLFHMFRWASDNSFTGKIPDYIGTWTALQDLYALSFFSFPLLTRSMTIKFCRDYNLNTSGTSFDQKWFDPLVVISICQVVSQVHQPAGYLRTISAI